MKLFSHDLFWSVHDVLQILKTKSLIFLKKTTEPYLFSSLRFQNFKKLPHSIYVYIQYYKYKL
jgi:hypothetical protein